MDSTFLTREATLQRTRLLLGLTDGAAVVAWSDALLLELPAPPPALLDVSGTNPTDLSALRNALHPLADDPVDPATVETILGEVARALVEQRRSASDTAHVLRQIRLMLPLPKVLDDHLDPLIDTLMLAEVGIGASVAEAETMIHAWAQQASAQRVNSRGDR